MSDSVNSPAHYNDGAPIHSTCGEPIEVIDFIRNFNGPLFNTVKYISRAGKKGDYLEDLRKAMYYLEDEIRSTLYARGIDPYVLDHGTNLEYALQEYNGISNKTEAEYPVFLLPSADTVFSSPTWGVDGCFYEPDFYGGAHNLADFLNSPTDCECVNCVYCLSMDRFPSDGAENTGQEQGTAIVSEEQLILADAFKNLLDSNNVSVDFGVAESTEDEVAKSDAERVETFDEGSGAFIPLSDFSDLDALFETSPILEVVYNNIPLTVKRTKNYYTATDTSGAKYKSRNLEKALNLAVEGKGA